eukprot:TRINITY_DN73222_c0_g1_i1.p2 TRINITY_DN73222_c0_g1~~TRINITY_DN73222_c0_g1_i1.p2  ORF type:complete len:736 (+),score=345.03 TRINITY_DN73222_c0_g1_i1:136-2343(+)
MARLGGVFFMPRRFCHVEVASGVRVHKDIVQLVESKIAPDTGVETEKFWKGFGEVYTQFTDKNKAFLDRRDEIQAAIDGYHIKNKGTPLDAADYTNFLKEIGYFEEDTTPFEVQSANTDREMAEVPGPQLVCPVDNARYIVNAANARWGSLLDALYGTDALPGAIPRAYCPSRGARVFSEVHRILDRVFPLAHDSWGVVSNIAVVDGALELTLGARDKTGLKDPSLFKGWKNAEDEDTLHSVLLGQNGLHFDILIDRNHAVGNVHPAGVYDVVAESALTVLADAEDSACTVDAADKLVAYTNWDALMKGTISVPVMKDDIKFERKLNPLRHWATPDGKGEVTLPGRAVLMCRNVGLHMYTDIVKTDKHAETPEHFLDALVTVASAAYDIKTGKSNSRTGSVYIVKPKMHSPEEVAFVDELFTKVEEILGLPKYTVKIGIMDEERRMTMNLRKAMRAAQHRVFFINTGFLDRVADEIHTSMQAGPMKPKEEIRTVTWIKAYEANSVDRGLETGLVGKGQVGKGMWAAPDNMAEMLEKKIGHLQAGATVAWVPSPTAATLHSLHYHDVDVRAVQEAKRSGVTDYTSQLLQPPLLDRELSSEEIQAELDCNCQSLLGYVVRWVGQGVGCSKVPDTNNVQLMEDRATLRISSQHIANWLHHGLITKDQVVETLKKMAVIVDEQNAKDRDYKKMAPTFDTIEFQAAQDLIFKGVETQNGYTEFVLADSRRIRKQIDAKSA